MKTRQYIDLTLTHAWASIRSEAKQTYIGYLWWLLDPLMFIGVYYVVFAKILGSKENDFIVFLTIGIIAYQWFQASVAQGASMIYNAGGLIKRIRLPKTLFPLSKVLHNFWQFIFVFIVYSIVIYGFMGHNPTVYVISVPVIMFTQIMIITGITYVLASLYPFFPDIKHVLQPILRALLFLSGIFFPATKVPESLQFYFYLNPMANLIEAYRDVMLRASWPDYTALLKVNLVAFFLIGVGLYLIRKFESDYAKVIP